MIGRVHDRSTFTALQHRGRRARRGSVMVVYLPSDDAPPRVAFGVGRKVGGAVVRNKIRRRLRAIMADLASGPSSLPRGTYLLVVRPDVVNVPYVRLTEDVAGACREAAR